MAKRAKKPPTEAERAQASVLVDALMLGRRAEVGEELATLVPRAISEYLRVYPMTRNNTKGKSWTDQNRTWVMISDWSLEETDFLCFFCRESLNCLPVGKTVTTKLQQGFQEHGEQCAMLFLSGMITGVKPQIGRR